MARQHKAPTQVTIVQEEKSAFAQWVENNWRMGAILAVAVTAAILASQIMTQKGREAESAEWESLRALEDSENAETILAGAGSLPPAQADLARLTAARIEVGDRDYDQALASLSQISADNALLSKLKLPIGADGAEVSVVEAAKRLIAEQKEMEAQLGDKLENPPPPADGPKVRLETDLGPIVIELYPEQAPKHVENFLARVDEGYYSNLKFHRVEKGRVIQTGDPNTREGDVSTWGQGGPEERVESEGKNGLVHVPYAVGMARSGADPKSSGSQFYITLSRQHQWDEDYTVFGVVRDPASIATLEKIEEVPLAEGSRPETPPVLLSAARE